MMKFLRMMTGNSDDPRYSEEKLLLRAFVFDDEHDNVGGIEQGFQDYLEVKLVSVTPDAEQTMPTSPSSKQP